MKIYHSSLSLPEVASLSKEDKASVCREAAQSVLRYESKKRAAGIGLWVGLFLIGTSIGRDYGFWGGLVGAVIGSGIGGVFLHQILVHATLPYIRESLRKRYEEKRA